MQSFDELALKLEREGRGADLKAIAESADGQRIESLLDKTALENAARTGDAAALGAMLKKVLSTDEGKRLAASVQGLFGGK